MIEIVFPSDTNQQLAESALNAQGIETRRGHAGCLEISREDLVSHLHAIDTACGDYNGRIWSD